MKVVGFVLAAVALALGSFIAGISSATFALSPSASDAPEAASSVRVGPTVLREIQRLNRIEGTRHTIQTVVERNKEGGWFNIGSEEIMLIAHGVVVAGVDLSNLSREDVVVSEDGTLVTITLPPAQILNPATVLDVNKTRVYSRKSGLLTNPDPQLETIARQEGVKQILAAACEAGILRDATQGAEVAVERLLLLSGITQIVFESSNQVEDCSFEDAGITETP